LSGTAGTADGDDTDVTIHVYAGTSATGSPVQTRTATVGGGGAFTVEATLPEGTYTAQAEQADEAGNTSLSNSNTFVVDATSPVVTLNRVLTPTRDATPDFTGQASETSTVTVEIFEGASLRQTLVVTPSGSGRYAVAGGRLADGTYTAQARQNDATGNTGSSLMRTFTIDTVRPTVRITRLHMSADHDRVVIRFRASEAGSTFRCRVDRRPLRDCRSPKVYENLPDGRHRFAVRGVDSAGNIGPATVRFFVI
jgi:hypothetical protein